MGAKLGITLRAEHRLRVFEERVLRRISGPEREEDGSWGKLHNDELHSLYSKVEKAKSLCLTKHHARKAYWGSGGTASRIL
jgi:hypothetical protein